MGNELLPIVRSQNGGCWILHGLLLNGVDHIERLAVSPDMNYQAKLVLSLSNAEGLQSPAPSTLCSNWTVDRPDVVWVLSV